MGQDKEQLKKLLEFISAIYDKPGNEDFSKGLKDLVAKDSALPNSQNSSIEQYMSLDFGIDNINFPDYSFIEGTSEEDGIPFKDRMNSYFREMLRYRYGTRINNINFDEFCRYYILQVEFLINYFLRRKYKSVEDAEKAIVDCWEQGKEITEENSEFKYKINTDPSKRPKNVFNIGLRYKIQHIRDVFNIYTLDFVYASYVRNSQSHASPEKETKKDKFIEWYNKQDYGRLIWNLKKLTELIYVDLKKSN